MARENILRANLLDLESADVVLVVSPEGGRTTYVEAGYALARDKPVLWVYGDNGATSIADAHPLSTVCKSIEVAIEAIRRVA